MANKYVPLSLNSLFLHSQLSSMDLIPNPTLSRPKYPPPLYFDILKSNDDDDASPNKVLDSSIPRLPASPSSRYDPFHSTSSSSSSSGPGPTDLFDRTA